MAVEIVNEATEELLDAMAHLLPQLSSSGKALSANQLEDLINQDCLKLFVFRDQVGNIEGMLSLILFMIPTGTRAWIEDVVVSQATRGQGAGQQLVEAASQYALEVGARTVDLTSRPSREAANRLYQRCGFVLRETNVYRFSK
ncbi:GNAT family N-acetyltransferase [Gleimia sp. 6138-11-ORH1]|uniref:GNAT family N-acetyltransferase n=1 Tax=Gleimia sp. 6138-11-ORH1 TaxID=2973937 RepID=UPI002167FE92|nr:GNAT family N-acetyltransferase [Gleimia sp. 6138-11-ORH1]MCS4484830.1 GNAT family N-acetyltransferase [Gleimia sp. 6138-11-ORH1]